MNLFSQIEMIASAIQMMTLKLPQEPEIWDLKELKVVISRNCQALDTYLILMRF